MRCLLLFVFLIVFFSASAQPQQGRATVSNTYRYFEVKDGLPQMQVWSLTEDTHGFIWVSTKDGLARWDGKNFHTWNSRTPGFGPAHARELIEAGNDEYIAITGFTARWIKGNRITRLMLADSITRIEMVFKLNDSEVIFSDCAFNNIPNQETEYPHIIYNYRKRKISRIIKTKGEFYGLLNDNCFITMNRKQHLNKEVFSLYLYSINKLLLDSLTGFENYPFLNFSEGALPYHYNSIVSGYDYNVDSPLRKLYQLSSENGHFHKREIILRTPITLCDKPKWIYVNDTTYYYIDSLHFVHLVNGNTNETYCKVGIANAAITDHNNNLWLGTEQGLYCFYSNSFRQYNFNFHPGGEDDIWSITRSSNGLYYVAAYKSGIYEYNDKVNSWRKIKLSLKDKTLDEKYKSALEDGTFSATRLWDGGVLLPLEQGFGIKNKNGVKVYMPLQDAETYSAITDTGRRCTYIAQYCHAYRINADYSLDTLCSAASVGLSNIMCCTIDKYGCPIFGGAGLKNNFVKYENGVFHPIIYNCRTPVSLCTDYGGNIWIAAADSFYFYDNKVVHPVNIPSQSLFGSVKAYNKKWLLIGTNKEFILLDLEAFYKKGQVNCYRYDYTNGFNTIDCSQNSMLIDDDGSVWIPTSKCIMRFYPENLAKETKTSTPVIDEISFSGKDFHWQPDTNFYQSSIIKTPNWRNLQFTFIAANINGASQLTYRYRLDGYSKDWSSPTTNNNATFNNLPPGNYSFEVESSPDGITWSKPTESPLIVLNPRFTERPVFLVLVIIVVIVIITGLTTVAVRNRFKKKQAKQKQTMQMLSLQLQSIRSKAIPHFTGNIFNNIDYLIEQKHYEDAKRYLAILSRLYNYILLDADKRSRTLADELQFVSNYLQLEKLRFKDKLHYKINVPPGMNTNIHVPNMALHTYVENAIKHGLMSKKGFGEISIDITEESKGIWMRVIDDGIGRIAAGAMRKYSTGMGLQILAQQIEIYNQRNKNSIKQDVEDLVNKEGKAAGTRFSIFVPFDYNYSLYEA